MSWSWWPSPTEGSASAPRPHIASRYRALVLVAAYGGLRIGELAGLRRSRVDLLRGTGQVAEIVVEVRGVLHASVSFTLDRYGHLYPEADSALRDRLDVLYGGAQPAPDGTVVRLRRRAGRGPRRPRE